MVNKIEEVVDYFNTIVCGKYPLGMRSIPLGRFGCCNILVSDQGESYFVDQVKEYTYVPTSKLNSFAYITKL